MPKVFYKGQSFILRWPEGSTRVLFRVARKYRKKGGTIDWQRAEADGVLKGLPKLSLKEVSRRYSLLRAQRHWTKKQRAERRRKVREYSRNHPKQRARNMLKRLQVFQQAPSRIKQNRGYNPKTIWNDKQRKLLVRLARMKKHRRGETEINWELLMKHPWVKKLPKRYHRDLNGLRRYYWNVARKDRLDPDYQKRHREDALRWKKKNRSRYFKNQERRRKMVNQSVNDFLSARMETF